MICPECQSSNLKKNSPKRGKQNYLCKNWMRQFIDSYSPLGYPDYVKKNWRHLYLEGNGFPRIERLTGVSHNIVCQKSNVSGCVQGITSLEKDLKTCNVLLLFLYPW